MMCFLAPNVLTNTLDLRLADRKGAILFLHLNLPSVCFRAQPDEFDFNLLRSSEIEMTGLMRARICTWSAVPLISSGTP